MKALLEMCMECQSSETHANVKPSREEGRRRSEPSGRGEGRERGMHRMKSDVPQHAHWQCQE